MDGTSIDHCWLLLLLDDVMLAYMLWCGIETAEDGHHDLDPHRWKIFGALVHPLFLARLPAALDFEEQKRADLST